MLVVVDDVTVVENDGAVDMRAGASLGIALSGRCLASGQIPNQSTSQEWIIFPSISMMYAARRLSAATAVTRFSPGYAASGTYLGSFREKVVGL